jgi:hypothetical protein
VETALQAGQRICGLILDAPICLTDAEHADVAPRWLEGVEPVVPAWNGEHLLRAWHMRRDMELWWPWYERRMATARLTEPRIDPGRLTVELRETMKQPASFASAWHAAIGYPMRRRLALTRQPCLLMAAPADAFARCMAQARAARPDARLAEVEDSPESRARAMHALLSG